MGEEVTQYEKEESHNSSATASAGSDGGNIDRSDNKVKVESIDETDRATPAHKSISNCDECGGIMKSPEKCENIKANCNDDDHKSVKNVQKPPTPPSTTHDEKSKKWYNISFMHRSNSSNNNGNSRSNNSSENNKKFAEKMDKRHSWHLNDSAVVEM